MTSPATSGQKALDELFSKVYKDALTGRGIFHTAFSDGALTSKHVPSDEIFRWKPRPFPGYSHAHSRKIRREARERAPVTIAITRTWLTTPRVAP